MTARRALAKSTPVLGSIISYTVSTIFFWTLTALLVPGGTLVFDAVLLFAAAGLFAPGAGRWLRLSAIQKIGVPITSSVIGSTPIFVIIGALLALEETLTVPIVVGILLVVAGVSSLGGGWERNKIVRSGISYALVSAIAFAAAAVLRKRGLMIVNSPIFAGAVGATAALLLLLVITLLMRPKLEFTFRDFKLFSVSGLLEALGLTTLFYGYSLGSVVLVEGLVNTTPLISMILSLVFLKEFEKVTRSVIVGGIIIVSGAIIIIGT